GVGASLAYTIEGLIRTGEFRTLRPAGGHIDPERLLTSLPGVGPQLARVLHERLGVSTLEQLERAAHDGRLAQAGVGPKRLRGLFSNTALAHRLNRTRDWVVISFHDGFTSGQRTVVTETVGDLRGRRVVRGRERECRAYYGSQPEDRGELALARHEE